MGDKMVKRFHFSEIIGRLPSDRDIVIHCEVRILLHIFNTENENENENSGTSKAYTYIGVSKLSCRGCQAFFESVNRVHKTRFVTKGSHSKAYGHWEFPESIPNNDMVLFYTYRLIAQRWVGFYDGYEVGHDPLAPDSDAQSGTSGSFTPDSTEQTGTSSGPHPTNEVKLADIYSLAEMLAKV